MAAKTLQFEIFPKVGHPEEWYWHLRARNGRVIATSGDSFKRKAHALREVKKIAADLGAGKFVVQELA